MPGRNSVVGSGVAVFVLYLGALTVNAAGFALTYAPVEYRQYRDRLVAYDVWLDELQWAVSVDRLRDASVVHTRLPDRLFGTRTVELTAGFGDDEKWTDESPRSVSGSPSVAVRSDGSSGRGVHRAVSYNASFCYRSLSGRRGCCGGGRTPSQSERFCWNRLSQTQSSLKQLVAEDCFLVGKLTRRTI